MKSKCRCAALPFLRAWYNEEEMEMNTMQENMKLEKERLEQERLRREREKLSCFTDEGLRLAGLK